MPNSEAKINIEISLHATLAKYRPDPKDRHPFVVQLAAGATVGHLMEACGIPRDHASFVVVNDVPSHRDTALADNAVVSVFPPMAGG